MRPTKAQVDQWLAAAAKGDAATADEITRDGFFGLAAEVLALRESEFKLERKLIKALMYSQGVDGLFAQKCPDTPSVSPVGVERT